MRYLSILISLSFLSIVACVRYNEPESSRNTATNTEQVATENGFEVMPNPYSIEVMQAVYDSLMGYHIELQPTDNYIRIMPQDTVQVNWLLNNGLELFDFPLHLKIDEGQEYVDPTIPEGEPGWIYTTTKPGFEFPEGFVYELLEECFIPEDGEEDEDVEPETRGYSIGPMDIERAAFERLGYKLDPKTRANVKCKGTINVWDNSDTAHVLRPLKGVKIRCHVVVKWSTAYTDAHGYYKTESNFAVKPHFAIVFENNKGPRFGIWKRYSSIERANFNMGWHKQGEYNRDISINDEAWPWAVINNAAWDYYDMCEKTGISLPPADLKIAAIANVGVSSAPMIRRISTLGAINKSQWGTFLTATMTFTPGIVVMMIEPLLKWLEPDLTIGTHNKTYRELYKAVNHELSHASHFIRAGKGYWERYVGYIVESSFSTDLTYGDGKDRHAGVCDVGEMWAGAMGHIQECEIYEPSRLEKPFFSIYGDFYRPDDGYDDNSKTYIDSWIHPDPIWALITKQVLTKKQIFDCLTSDVDTKEKLRNKLLDTYFYKAKLINEAFDTDNIIILPKEITGKAYVGINDNISYSVPEKSYELDFERYSITPNTYTTTGGLYDPNLTIKFLEETDYTITAHYSGGRTVQKIVGARTVATPVITYYTNDKNPLYSDWITPGFDAFFSVSDPQSNLTYEWKVVTGTLIEDTQTIVWEINEDLSGPGDFSTSFRCGWDYNRHWFIVSCRAKNSDGIMSEWSNEIKIYVRY